MREKMEVWENEQEYLTRGVPKKSIWISTSKAGVGMIGTTLMY